MAEFRFIRLDKLDLPEYLKIYITLGLANMPPPKKVPPIAVRRADNWKALLSFYRHGWIYRGQRDSTWDLQTSLERACVRRGIPPDRWRTVESELLRAFKRSYHHYDSAAPGSNREIEWTSLMQHHGAPTRLLDFTYSIYIAAFFALDDAIEKDMCAIWAINCDWLVSGSIALLKAGGAPHADRLAQNVEEDDEPKYFETLFEPTPPVKPTACLAIVNAFRLTERLRIQKGVFLAPGDVSKSCDDNLRALPNFDKETSVVKILIPGGLRDKVIRELNYMNISPTTLFPGLDGFARSLSSHHLAYAEPQSGLIG